MFCTIGMPIKLFADLQVNSLQPYIRKRKAGVGLPRRSGDTDP